MLNTLKDWELAIVRVAERYPDRVGLRGQLTDTWTTGLACTEHCIMGQILHDAGTCGHYPVSAYGLGGAGLIGRAVVLNNAGVKWGAIPVLLGLVPGEQPAEAAVEESVAAGVAR